MFSRICVHIEPMKAPLFTDKAVEKTFAAYPAKLRKALLALRGLIYDTAARVDGTGQIVETLKWSQPAYLTEKPKSGSTIRIGAVKGEVDSYAMYFHCQSNLVPTFRELYPDTLAFEGNRAIHLTLGGTIPKEELAHCIGLALTYHLRRARR
jgi:hypothetical protein